MKGILKTKTFWVAVAGMLTAVGAFVGAEISLSTLLLTIFAGLLGIFVRDALPKPE